MRLLCHIFCCIRISLKRCALLFFEFFHILLDHNDSHALGRSLLVGTLRSSVSKRRLLTSFLILTFLLLCCFFLVVSLLLLDCLSEVWSSVLMFCTFHVHSPVACNLSFESWTVNFLVASKSFCQTCLVSTWVHLPL